MFNVEQAYLTPNKDETTSLQQLVCWFATELRMFWWNTEVSCGRVHVADIVQYCLTSRTNFLLAGFDQGS